MDPMIAPSAQSLQLTKESLAAANEALTRDLGLAKAAGITQATGLVAYDLEAPAKSLFPVITPLRNAIPRVGGGIGTATHWKAVTGINTTIIDPGVGEGNRGAVVTTSTADYVATYKGLGLEDFVTFEADYAAQTFDDVKARAVRNLLWALMIQEEFVLLAGNATLIALGTTPTPTVTTSTTGGSIAATTAYNVIAVALTADGLRRSTVAAGLPVGAITKTNADGTTDTVNPGTSIKSTAGSVTTGAGSTNSISASVTPVAGAAGYAWFAGASGSEKLSQITTLNSVLITVIPTTTQAASAGFTADLSKNANVFDGLLALALQSGSGAYVAALATGTAGTGTTLTSDGAGGITEFTTACQDRWDNYRLSFDTWWVTGRMQALITKIIVANGGAPLARIIENGGLGFIDGGVVVKKLMNPITSTMVNVNVHPNMPAGMSLLEATSIPYPISNVGNVRQIRTRREYYQLEWPLRTRKYEYGVYVDEVLQHYFTPALGVIYNVAGG